MRPPSFVITPSPSGDLLFPGEELLSFEAVPFQVDSLGLGLDLLVDVMTNSMKSMPLASRALDDSKGEGLFEAEFGRDALMMASFVGDSLSALTDITVRRLCELQGVADHTQQGERCDGEAIGKIPHEARSEDDPIAQEYSRDFGWEWPYFGSLDSTPMFISAAFRVARRNPSFLAEVIDQRDGVSRTIGECVARALTWMLTAMSESDEGFLATTMASNRCWQVWMDSIDAYHHADGSLAQGSLAALEVQAFAYDALRDAIDLVDGGVFDFDVDVLQTAADKLRQSFFEHFWIPFSDHGPFFASGVERVDGSVRSLQVRTANMGLLLDSRLLEGSHGDRYVQAIVQQLFDWEGLWSPNGVRTLAADEARFRPFSYHNGSIWPWQNLAIANGLRRHGHVEHAHRIEETMMRVSNILHCMPEFIHGGDDVMPRPIEAIAAVRSQDGHGNTFEHKLMQPAQKFQGWTVFGLYALTVKRRAAQVA